MFQFDGLVLETALQIWLPIIIGAGVICGVIVSMMIGSKYVYKVKRSNNGAFTGRLQLNELYRWLKLPSRVKERSNKPYEPTIVYPDTTSAGSYWTHTYNHTEFTDPIITAKRTDS